MTRAIVLAIALAVNSCDPPKAVEKPVEQRKVDLWQRMQQCNEAARRVISGPEWRRADGTSVVSNWQNHYNTQDERCYVKVFQPLRNKDRREPLAMYELIDALENRQILACTDDKRAEWSAGFCDLPEGETPTGHPCEACQRFINDRMTR